MTDDATDALDRAGESATRYTRVAIDRRWNPATIDLERDAEAVAELDRIEFTRLRGLLAQFGAGEQAVTEDLAPLAVVVEEPADQRFVATQLYDEAVHAEFFDRYWERVIRPAERTRGLGESDPTDDRWHAPAYRELFDRTERAMTRLLERDGPETRARAYCHYHLTVEGTLALTAYDWIRERYGGETAGVPALSGLLEGVENVRRDEGRHVGFGCLCVRDLLESGAVEPGLVRQALADLLEPVEATIAEMATDDARPALLERVEDAHEARLAQVGLDPQAR
ncbi:ribonucleotide-diphosphate reductase subunit beta [Natrialbaceae archaeon AArc-T1-2]|uniref:ribonucleotide-diphosphate reductase subunit beta n=1 Tax=Natrialbaceae archaeon AArc-T1-2 TaxID=3053904 RepID=UPI00255AB6CA|nr:ribonucleotide-diphosphate reductase subunit beta [Natrialbaceae archaeon AArc-T1-2]WIV65985.1 ribonucleotide-diphosphate reductase subunit beta [Natrialbaceae archaeon AArc-T1-2]